MRAGGAEVGGSSSSQSVQATRLSGLVISRRTGVPFFP